VIVVSGSTVTAASSRYGVLVGFTPTPCTRTDEAGVRSTDPGLDRLIAAARSGSDPVISPIFDVPGDCRPVVAVALRSGTAVVVTLGDVSELTKRLAAGSLITAKETSLSGSRDDALPPGGTRILLVTENVAFDPQQGVVTVPPRVSGFIARAPAGGSSLGRYAIGEGDDAQVLAALVPVTGGWSVVLEQDAAIFDIELQNRPSIIVASVLTVTFAVVFALLAFFDVRRRRAHRRAEVAKNAFFSIAGHELRTPLTVIKGFAETLSNHWDDLTEDRRRSLVQRIVPQSRRLDRLVERLLVAASIQAETHLHPEIRGVDPLAALASVAERFRPEAPLHTFVVESEGDIPQVRADPRSFEQAIDHLVDNAVKYSPAGGRITLRVVNAERRVLVVVEDEGVGLPSDYRHIFDKFVQGESVTKRVHDEGGVGLGLYIVRTLVEEMGGTVRAEPREVEGARFIVSLKPLDGLEVRPLRPHLVAVDETAGQETVSYAD
jgi:signal transduction histidine kinase